MHATISNTLALQVVMFTQPDPKPELPVFYFYTNNSKTLCLVDQQVAKSDHQSLLIEPNVVHDNSVEGRVHVDRLVVLNGGCHLL